MKSLQVIRALAILGAALTVAGLLLPIWSKNGIGISGFEGSYLSLGRWVLMGASLGSLLVAFVPSIRNAAWMGILGGVTALQASLILWKGYKLGAIGMGVWILLLAAGVMLANAILMHNGRQA